MKLRLLLILSFVFTLSAYADDARIVIKQKSGNETTLELAFNPVITFSSVEMVIKSDLTTISFPLDDIDSYKVYNGTTDIQKLSYAPQFANGHVAFRNLPQGAEVRVYRVDGSLVNRHAADASGHADVSLDSLPKGMYVVSTPNNNIKIINK